MDKKNREEKKENNHRADEQPQQEQTVTVPEAEYNQLKADAQKAAENADRVLRLQADFENVRKRWERERQEFTKFANEELLCDMLNIVDELERSLELSQQKNENYQAFLKGVEMILAHIHDLLKKHGVVCMEAQGKCFDPQYHEALMTVEKDDCPEHTIVDEMQKGYMMNDRVLRTAKVQVSRRKQQEQDKEQGKEKHE
ncbi:MAG: nucleotide exchange factor GrpE [Candidatus Omnitrophica bacterium]|nr:nucleotide exchange factor GrpE [Candidatus Omnitrophota bacterium]MDD5775661.1 nucleotide exchange factor GrpE [Candidatus Omnitrophota bacterium]